MIPRLTVLAILLVPHVVRADEALTQSAWSIVSEKCLACHGNGKKLKSNLDLRTRDGAIKGGEQGSALTPGDAEKSPLYIAVTRKDDELQMPPKEKDALSSEQVDVIRRWIVAGAQWPSAKAPTTQWSDAASDGVVVATSGGLSEQWSNRKYKPEDLWAYQPIKRYNPPSDVRNQIDSFIQQKLKDKGITQSTARADKVTLTRRLTIDLTGLPPQTQDASDSYDKLVDRLLASPQYGEQMARHWLDVVRYADTSGYSNDFERPNAWRYRDYVIRSFNNDKPFDRFIIEQLAGDELDANDPEKLIATGFIRMGPWEQTAMTVAAVTRQQFLDDITQSVGVTFLAQAMRCASCHDHKFDPVPTRDYYRMQAVFASAQFAEKPAAFLGDEKVDAKSAAHSMAEQSASQARDVLAQLQKKNQQAIAAYLKEKGVAKFEDLPAGDRPNRGEFGLSKDELSLRKTTRKRLDYLERELERYEALAMCVYSGTPNGYSSVRPEQGERKANAKQPLPTTVPTVRILTGGSLESPSEEVSPGVLSAVHESNDRVSPTSWNTIPQTTSGRRLALATWIASGNNTLTARVIVNRVWQMHFGKGLVATPNNFGKMGAKPTHPELLDFLATWFIDHGWSIKSLHWLILTSDTYQQAGEHPLMQKLAEIDSKNDLLAYFPPRRLAAEEIRDAMLAASGEINLEMGGPGVFPQINWEVAFQPRHVMGSVAPPYQPSRMPQERNRRTIYAFRIRTLADPMLEVFNRPGTETSCERRSETTITPQAFTLLNSEFTQARALAIASLLRREQKTVEAQIAGAFERVYGRAPTTEESRTCAAHVARMLDHHQKSKPSPTTFPTTVHRHMVEEMTGEDLQWDEPLDRLRDYEPDLTPAQADVETRALAELCLVLLNSNEFLYVR